MPQPVNAVELRDILYDYTTVDLSEPDHITVLQFDEEQGKEHHVILSRAMMLELAPLIEKWINNP